MFLKAFLKPFIFVIHLWSMWNCGCIWTHSVEGHAVLHFIQNLKSDKSEIPCTITPCPLVI